MFDIFYMYDIILNVSTFTWLVGYKKTLVCQTIHQNTNKMNIRFKICDHQGGADLSSKPIDVDALIAILEKAKERHLTEHNISVMCDDWHRCDGRDPHNGRCSNHHGEINLRFW